MELRHHLDNQIKKIDANLADMTSGVCRALSEAGTLLNHYDAEVAERVKEQDKTIDAQEMAIDDSCLQLIATEQPVAGDLRKIIAITKITADLERIGDIARYVARHARKEVPENFIEYIPRLVSMGEHGIKMLRDAMAAFQTLHEQRARQVAGQDDKLDEMHQELRREIIRSMRNDPEHIKNGQRLLVISRLMELLGDHVTTMCEWIIFAINGEHTDLN